MGLMKPWRKVQDGCNETLAEGVCLYQLNSELQVWKIKTMTEIVSWLNETLAKNGGLDSRNPDDNVGQNNRNPDEESEF